MSGGEISNMEIEKSLSVHGLQETIAYLHKIEMGFSRTSNTSNFAPAAKAVSAECSRLSTPTSPNAMSRK